MEESPVWLRASESQRSETLQARLVPRLYARLFDPSARTQATMTRIWNTCILGDLSQRHTKLVCSYLDALRY